MRIANWVRTGENVGFPFTSMPAYTVLPMVPCLFYARLWTISLAFICTVGVWYMARKGFTLGWLYRRFKGRLHGNRISARPIWFIRRFSFLSDPTSENDHVQDFFSH